MLKKRIVGCLTVLAGRVVQSIGFRRYLPVCTPEIGVQFLNQWGIDEIIILKIDPQRHIGGPDLGMISSASGKGFVPLCAGGGIRNVEDMRALIHCGADKIAINSLALDNPGIISQAACVLGTQCVVVSIDALRTASGDYKVFSRGKELDLDVFEWADKAARMGAGEILLNSVECDGAKNGFDYDLMEKAGNMLEVPLIACGGAGHPQHFFELFSRSKAAAGAAGNFFHFSEHAPTLAKAYLVSKGVDIRLDTYADYEGAGYDSRGRLSKRSDEYLEKLFFEYIPEEII